jgi:hypothetical protein
VVVVTDPRQVETLLLAGLWLDCVFLLPLLKPSSILNGGEWKGRGVGEVAGAQAGKRRHPTRG